MRNITKIVVPVGIAFIVILTVLFGGPAFWWGAFQDNFLLRLFNLPNFLYTFSVILGGAFVISLFILLLKLLRRQDIEFPQRLVAVFGVAFVVCSAAFIGVFWWSASQHHQAKSIHIDKMESWSEADCRNLSSSQLNHYPAIKKAIGRDGKEIAVNVSLSEISRLRDLGDCIEVDGSNYGIKLYDIVIAKEVAAEEESVGELPFLEEELATIYEGSYAKSSARIESMSDDARYRMDKGGTPVILPDGFMLTNVTLKELVKAREFEGVIKHNGSYYRVYVDCKLILNKDYSIHPACTKVSEKELRDQPALKQDLEKAREEGSATISDLPEGWSNCIKYNGNYYKIRIAMA